MPILTTITAISGSYSDIARNLFVEKNYLYKSAFFPSGQADLTASASFEPIRGGRPQLHGPTPRICGKLDLRIIQVKYLFDQEINCRLLNNIMIG
jgi:hypothetical protein